MVNRIRRTAVPVVLFLVGAGSHSQAQKPIQDTPFWQDYHESYPLATPQENDVRCVRLDKSGRVWAGTSVGVRYLEKGKWSTPRFAAEMGPVYCLYSDPEGEIWAGAWNGIYRVTTGLVIRARLTDKPISAISGSPTTKDLDIVAAGPQGMWRFSGGDWKRLPGSWNRAVRATMPAENGKIWIGTASGLYKRDANGIATRYSKPDVILSSNINSLTPLRNGTFCIGTSGGIDIFRNNRRVRSLTVKQGLPARDARAIAQDGLGRLWVATNLGVARYDAGKWNLRHSRRWLQTDDTRDVTIGPDGTAWVATSGGVDAIRRKRMTLADKADFFLKMVRARHIREPGLVGPAVLEKVGDISKSFIEDDDNDGEHTGMYCAMESMRYAVTKAPDARENAKAAFHALMVLQRATGTKHFIARSVLPIGTAPRHEVDRTFTPEEIADSHRTEPREKIIEKRWIPTADGKYLWKRDASSDEVDGHMFGYANYFDLAADPAEKKLVADQVDRIIGGIVDHGFVLQDIDGKATRWGNWSPASLNGDPQWYEERGGNSVEIIAHIGVAYHMTGKQKYKDAARLLIEKHGYAENMLTTKFDTPSEKTHINDELLSMVYPNLMKYLIFPSLKQTALTSFHRWHKNNERDGIPFYDFAYNGFSGKRVPLDRGMEILREWPLDLVEWTVDNSKREDVQFDKTPGFEPGRLTKLLPRGEMGICMWDQEPYKSVIGRGGDREDKPTDWLLAYWMGRYYGLVSGPKK